MTHVSCEILGERRLGSFDVIAVNLLIFDTENDRREGSRGDELVKTDTAPVAYRLRCAYGAPIENPFLQIVQL